MTLGTGAGLFTRKKRKKAGLVNTDKVRLRTNSLHVFLPVQAYLTYKTVKGLQNGPGQTVPRRKASRNNRNNRGLAWPG